LPARAQDANAQDTNAVSEASTLAATNSEAIEPDDTNDAASDDTWDKNGPNNVQPLVLFGQNAELKTNETAEAVVVIGGNAEIHGRVHEAVVVIGGNVEVDGEVGDAVVAIFGNVHVMPKAVIHQDAVAVLGNTWVAAGTKVRGNAVSIGGKLDIEDGAVVKGDKVNLGLPGPFANLDWLRNWFKYCVFEFRPLAPQVGFVWVIALGFFLVYLLIAALFPRPIETCVDDLHQRPATTFLIGLLTKLLVPFLYLILAATGVGLIVVPFIWVALLLCAIVGKVALIEWLGFKLGTHFGKIQKPLAAFLVGTIFITLLYIIPVIGILTYTLLAVWGLGCGVSTAFTRLRRETPDKPIPPTTQTTAASVSPIVPPVIDPGIPPAPASTPILETKIAPEVAPGTAPLTIAPVPVAPAVSAFPKANLLERLCAAFLDIILIGIISGIAHLGSFSLFVALAYFAGMWTWRGTTIGGIVLKLKVVRTDGRPLTFVITLVRGLAAAFSAVIFFLGFLWIIWDKDKQGWHDKIAGTEVIRLPHSTPLVVL
jgi:uncharacterized RDD family membrane protein YckC